MDKTPGGIQIKELEIQFRLYGFPGRVRCPNLELSLTRSSGTVFIELGVDDGEESCKIKQR